MNEEPASFIATHSNYGWVGGRTWQRALHHWLKKNKNNDSNIVVTGKI